jgi:hypothetical protein
MSRKHLVIAGLKGLAVGALLVGPTALMAAFFSHGTHAWNGPDDPECAFLCGSGWYDLSGSPGFFYLLAGTLVLGPLVAWAVRLREPWLYGFFLVFWCVGVLLPLQVLLAVLLVAYPALAVHLAREDAPQPASAESPPRVQSS